MEISRAKSKISGLHAALISLWLTGCGQGESLLTWSFPAYEGRTRASALSLSDSPLCNADFFVGAEDREAGEVTSFSPVRSAFLDLAVYGGGSGDLLSNTLAETLRMGVSVSAGGSWRLVAEGGASLSYSGLSASPYVSTDNLQLLIPTFTNFTAANWSCPTGTLAYFRNLGAELYTGTLDNDRVLLPVYGESAPKTVELGQTIEVSLPVQVARVPFGLYSKTSFVGEDANDYADFDGQSGSAGSVSEDEISPFYLLKLVGLNLRASVREGNFKVFPIIRNLDTGVVWRGLAESTLIDFGIDPLHLYPLPGRRFDITLAFRCVSTPCSVRFQGAPADAPMPLDAVFFLQRRVDFDQLDRRLYEAGSAHQFQSDLIHPSWRLSYAHWPSPPTDGLLSVARELDLNALLNGGR